ncbi:hypothetical protein JCM10207_000154 [Rhodosporidiobolus poonsookiae]
MTADHDWLAELTHQPQKSPLLRNWSSTYNCTPSLLFLPVSTAEVQLIFRQATKQRKKVRVVGEHNSPGPGWHGDWLISTRHFTSLTLSVPTRTATVGSGVPLRSLHRTLASHGLALPCVGSIPDVSAGAYFSGPDHGSSHTHGVTSTFAQRVRVVTPAGEVVDTYRGEELFRASGAGVGATGCITEVEWELDEAFGLEVTMERVRLADYLKDSSGRALWELARSEEFVKIWHFPQPALLTSFSLPDTILWRARRVPLPPPSPPGPLGTTQALLVRVLHALAMLVTLYLFPSLQGVVNAVLYWSTAWRLPQKVVSRSYEAQSMDCLYNQLVDEWTCALPAPTSPPSLPHPVPAVSILRRLTSYLTSTHEGQSLGMHTPLEIRFSAVEAPEAAFYLSPGAPFREEGKRVEGDLVMWVEPIVYRPLNLPTPARFFAFFQRFEGLFRAASPPGRPHWCKAHFPSSPAEVERMFPSSSSSSSGEAEGGVQAFHRVRRGADPQGLMWTQWLEERVPGGSGSGGSGKEEGRGSVHGKSEAAAKRSARWEDVMGMEKAARGI